METLKDCLNGEYQFTVNNMIIKIAMHSSKEEVISFPKKSALFQAIENRFDSDVLFTFNETAFFSTVVHCNSY